MEYKAHKETTATKKRQLDMQLREKFQGATGHTQQKLDKQRTNWTYNITFGYLKQKQWDINE